MTGRAFTRGPWTAERFGVVVGGPSHQYVNGAGQSQIASVMGFTLTTAEDPIAEREANTHLIAAAPELYEALSAILYWHDEDRHIDESWWEDARAALAKARGEKP